MNALNRVLKTEGSQPWMVAGDIDGFFGLAIDNLIQFLLILALCTGALGFPIEVVLGKILPAAAISILLGNLFYAWQAQKLSQRTGRTDVTALPYGINTVSLFAYVFLVMMPVKLGAQAEGMSETEAATLAWQIGLAACLVSGLIEFAGSFVAEFVRKHTPRAALLSTLAGIAISFIAIDFAIKTFENPLVALLPLGVILTTYFSHERMPFRIPGGAWALALGTAAAWLVSLFGGEPALVQGSTVSEAFGTVGVYLPVPVLGDMIAGLTHPLALSFLVPVMLPMGLFNVLGSLQNIESAEAAGDSYPTMPSLAVNGAGSIVAALLGSCFPTTIYIGHPGWKGLGARSGYSVLNGIFFAILAFFGLTWAINAIIPMEAGMAIVLWIGIVMAAQAFQATPNEHAPAVATGLFPAIAAWGLLILGQVLGAANFATGDFSMAGTILEHPEAFEAAGLHLDGLVATSQGFMLTCMVWAAASACLIDRSFLRAAAWVGVGALFSFFGFMHAGEMTPAGGVYDIGFGTGWRWSVGYLMCGGFFVLMHTWVQFRDRATG
jgi:AGZA family xanthine/uracil permease-like MFS transporter